LTGINLGGSAVAAQPPITIKRFTVLMKEAADAGDCGEEEGAHISGVIVPAAAVLGGAGLCFAAAI
jgi:hypothetical protein